MNLDLIEAYLTDLALELRKQGASDRRFMEEARDHLTDAVEQGIQHGLDVQAAQHDAIKQFGEAAAVARTFVADAYRLFDRLVMLAAMVPGIIIATLPNWDDTGVAAFLLVMAAAMCGFIAPRQPWRWAIAVGLWTPVLAVARSTSAQSLAMLLALAFPFAGAYLGMALRRAMVLRFVWASGQDAGDFHDKKGFYFATVMKHGHIDPELAAIIDDPDTHLVPFLERMAPEPLAPLGKPESISALNDPPHKGDRTYQVVFGGEKRIVCKIEISGGKKISAHWSRL